MLSRLLPAAKSLVLFPAARRLMPSSRVYLYRGCDVLRNFSWPNVLLGEFNRHHPEGPITFEHLQRHQKINEEGLHRFVSLSKNANVAKNFGNGNYLVADLTPIKDQVIDLDKVYEKVVCADQSDRLRREEECVIRAFPQALTKEIRIGNRTIKNPWYIDFSIKDDKHKIALDKLKSYYPSYLSLFINKFKHGHLPDEGKLLQYHAAKLIDIYDSIEDSPFKLTVAQFCAKHKDYADLFLKQNPDFAAYLDKGRSTPLFFQKEPLSLADILYSKAPHAFNEHVLTRTENFNKEANPDLKFSHEDEYARPNYD